MSTFECLPEDVLDQILNGMVLLSDIIRFGAVCKTWYRVFLIESSNLIMLYHCYLSLQLICISTLQLNLIPRLTINNCSITLLPNQLFSVFEKKCYNSMQPIPRSWESWSLGSSYGWLAAYIQNPHTIIIFNNPITGNTIYLPTIRDWLIEYPMLVLSSNPSINPEKCVVALSTRSVWFIRLPGNKWSKCKIGVTIGAMVFHEGKLYALDKNKNLVAIYLTWESSTGDECDFQSYHVIEMSGFDQRERLHLAESLSEELLMIVRRNTLQGYVFRVYKLVVTHDDDDGNEKMKGHWARTHRLGNGDEVLYLSENNNVICSRCMNLQPNSIYFASYDTDYDKRGHFRVTKHAVNEEMEVGEYIELGVTLRKLYGVWGDLQAFWINPTL